MKTKRSLWFGSVCLILLAAGTAKADPFCDERVVDETGVLGSGLPKVQAAADKLAASGADVRVRVVSSLKGQGNMDLLFQAVLKNCPSWQAPGGGRKNNLHVQMLMPVTKPDGSAGAKVGLYHGDQWTRTLGTMNDSTIVTSIIKNDMAPHVRDGRYADGVAAGLNAVTARIEAQVANPVPQTQAPVQQVPVQPPVVVHEQPTDFTGLWWVFGSLVGLGAIVLLVMLIGKNRKSKADARAAQQKAKSAKINCAAYITELDQPVALFEAAINQAAQNVSEEDVSGLRASLQQAKSDLDGANQRFRELNDNAGSVNDPDVDGRSEQEYAGIESAYNVALGMFRGVREAADSGRTKCSALTKLPGEAKAALEELNGVIDAALKTVEGTKAQGFQVETQEALLAEAERCYDQAGSAIGQKRFSASKTLSAQGKEGATRASTQADALPDRKAALDASIAKLGEKLPVVKNVIKTAKAVADDLVASYAEACFKTVRGNGVEAINRFEAAVAALPTAKDQASMERQQWSAAETTVAAANKALDEAVSLMNSIASLKPNLDKAKQDAPGEIQAAKADIAAAKAFISSNAGDINDALELDLARQLSEATQAVAQAETEARNRDFPKAVQLALSANKTADKILANAKDDQQATLRQRRLAEQSIQQAQTAIDRSKEYIDDHSSVGPYTAKENLAEAKTLLANAKKTSDLATRISLAEQAEEKAKAALKSVKAAVKKDQESRSQNWGGSSSGSSGSDAFLGGLAGGAIGSSIGRSSSSSSSRSSSSDSIFGGGGGGGSFDIGGSSGGGGGSFDIGGGGGDSGGGGSSDI